MALALDQPVGPAASVSGDGEADAEPAVQETWRAAAALLAEDLLRRDAAARTRRAYATDLAQFVEWASACGLRPTGVGPRELRRYVAHLSQTGLAPATIARALASLRALFASQREHGQIAHSPADLIATPKRAVRLPRVLRVDDVAALLDRIPACSPLELRDRALFELAYACGLRAEELVSLGLADVDHDGEQLRVEGKGRKTRYVPVGEHALAALRRYLDGARPALAAAGAGAGEASPPCARPTRTPCSSASPAGGSLPATCAAGCACGSRAPGCPARPPRTRCATASPRTCSTAVRTCARSRSCSDIRASRPPRFTLG